MEEKKGTLQKKGRKKERKRKRGEVKSTFVHSLS